MLGLHEEKEKLTTKLRDDSTQADISMKMIDLANESLKSSRDSRREHADEVAKLREELEKERVARAEVKIEFEVGLAQAKRRQKEAWKALEEEHRLHEEDSLSEKAAFIAALEEEKGLRVVTETKIQALEGELKTAQGTLSRTKADLNGARARIRSAVTDYKKSPAFDNYVELRRQQ